MEKGLRFYRSKVIKERRRTSKPTVLTLENCLFVSMESFQEKNDFIEILFEVGDLVKFLGNYVMIKEVMMDENQNIIYRVVYPNGRETSIEQGLLKDDSMWRDNLNAPSKLAEQPAFLPMEEVVATVEPIEAIEEVVSLAESKTKVQKQDSYTLENVLFKDSISLEKAEEDMKEIAAFLEFGPVQGDIKQCYATLIIYKFLVQNSQFDDSILELEKENIKNYWDNNNEILKMTRPITLIFQSLLKKVGIESQIVVLKNKNDGNIYNTLLVSFSKISHLFDVEQERIIQKEGVEEMVPFFSMAGLNLGDYQEDYEVLGVLPQNGSKRLLPISSSLAKKKMDSAILKGYQRGIPDLVYSKKEKVI